MMKTFVWKVSTKDINMASFRYRCLMPFRWMKELDPNSRHVILGNSDFFYPDQNTSGVIFVKSFSNIDAVFARKAYALNIPIYIDICDNFFHRIKAGHFINQDEKPLLETQYKNYKYILSIATAVITTSTELAAQIIEESPMVKPKVLIIPDCVDNDEDQSFFDKFRNNPQSFSLNRKDLFFGLLKNIPYLLFRKGPYLYVCRRLLRMLSIVGRNTINPELIVESDTKTIQEIKQLHERKILWFGNAGIPKLFGITDILIVEKALIELNNEIPFVLIVCSNNKAFYEKFIKPLPFRTEYFNWSLELNIKLLQECHLVIVPNPSNPFTLGKSANRALLTLEYKKPVVATYTSALDSISELVLFDDWKKNISEVLNSNIAFERKWERDWSTIKSIYSSKNNAQKWLNILKGI